MEPFRIRAVWLSLAFALIASLAAYCLILGLATTHEELNLTRDRALPVAIWTLLVAFAGSLLYFLGRRTRGPGA
jgi:hypothetical protein